MTFYIISSISFERGGYYCKSMLNFKIRVLRTDGRTVNLSLLDLFMEIIIIKLEGKITSVEVSDQANLDSLKTAIKSKFAIKCALVDAIDIIIKTSDGAQQLLNGLMLLSNIEIADFGRDQNAPFIVEIPVSNGLCSYYFPNFHSNFISIFM